MEKAIAKRLKKLNKIIIAWGRELGSHDTYLNRFSAPALILTALKICWFRTAL